MSIVAEKKICINDEKITEWDENNIQVTSTTYIMHYKLIAGWIYNQKKYSWGIHVSVSSSLEFLFLFRSKTLWVWLLWPKNKHVDDRMFIREIHKANSKAYWKIWSISEFRNEHVTHQTKEVNCRTGLGMARFNTLRLRTNSRHFASNILRLIFLNRYCCILIQI